MWAEYDKIQTKISFHGKTSRANTTMKKHKEASFTKKMKKTHTIFLPQMLMYHSDLLKAAFEGSGYHLEIMSQSQGLKEEALRYISNDSCYPTVLIIGQVLRTLKCGLYPADRIAFMEPQAGGACRAGNIYQTIRRVLAKCGQEQIPVLSLNFMGQERQPGFRITPRLLSGAIAAVCCGDLCMGLYHQVSPYECKEGAAREVLRQLYAGLAERIRNHKGLWGENRRQLWRDIIRAFEEIPVKSGSRKMVGVVGEIYIKFSPLGNHGLERFLAGQNCQCRMGGFVNYAIYVMDSARTEYRMNHRFPVLTPVFDKILFFMKRLQRELYEEITRSGRFVAESLFDDMKKKAAELIGESCVTGDGWLVAAEAADAIEQGCKHILIVHQFGCLVSHICERGIVGNLRRRYPGVSIQSVEYDYDSSDTLRESRILLALGGK